MNMDKAQVISLERTTAEVVPVSDILISKVPFIIYAMYSNCTVLARYCTAITLLCMAVHGNVHGRSRQCTVTHGIGTGGKL